MPFTFSQQPCYTGLPNQPLLKRCSSASKSFFCWNNVGPLRLYATLKCVYSVRVWVRRTIIFTSIIIYTPSVSHEGRIRKEGSFNQSLHALSKSSSDLDPLPLHTKGGFIRIEFWGQKRPSKKLASVYGESFFSNSQYDCMPQQKKNGIDFNAANNMEGTVCK